MKKAAFCIIPLIMFFMGCASSEKAMAETNGNSPGMDLDTAIKKAAAQMEAKIPSKTKIALVSVASPSTAFSTQVLTRLESAIVSSGKLVVVDRANLDKIREEQGFQLSGEVDDESAKSIGKLSGAGAIVTGALADLGDVYSLTLKAIDIETATVAVSYLADLAKSARIETLLASGGGGAGTGTAAAQKGGTAPAVASVPVPAAEEPAKVYKIGDTGPAGGIVFYDKGVFTNGWRYMEAAPNDIGPTQWGAYGTEAGGTNTATGTGRANTQRIVPVLNRTGDDGAALLCSSLNIDGYTGWFLPSKDELNLLYVNLKVKGLGGFDSVRYWSSSEGRSAWASPSYNAWTQNFSDGSQDINSGNIGGYGDKNRTYSVRAVRQF
jgi:hypothetical protein